MRTSSLLVAIVGGLLLLGGAGGLAPRAHAGDDDQPAPALDFPDESLIQKADGSILYFYRTNFVAPDELIAGLSHVIGVPGVAFRSLPGSNTVVMEGQPDDVSIALEAAAYLDVAVPQVFVEATFIEVVHRSDEAPDQEEQGGEGDEGGGEAAEHEEEDELRGHIEVLAKPSVLATQGRAVEVSAASERSVPRLQTASDGSFRFLSSTVTTQTHLRVEVRHVGESFVTLEIQATVQGETATSALASATGEPQATTFRLQTSVSLADGETLVVGGLRDHRRFEEEGEAPPRPDTSWLRWLLPRREEASSRREIVLMIHPVIVRKTADLKLVVPPSVLEEMERSEGKDDGGD